jgi:hypothetical protein
VAGVFEHGNEPAGSIKKAGFFLTNWVTISFSNNILHHGISISYVLAIGLGGSNLCVKEKIFDT